jgi:hypothetical protein
MIERQQACRAEDDRGRIPPATPHMIDPPAAGAATLGSADEP